jgi:hypothetical protein
LTRRSVTPRHLLSTRYPRSLGLVHFWCDHAPVSDSVVSRLISGASDWACIAPEPLTMSHRTSGKSANESSGHGKAEVWAGHVAASDSSYTLDRMVSLLLGRPPGISDDDIDAELPSVEAVPGATRPMASAVHYIKLKQLESKIQRAVFTIGRRASMTVSDVYAFLQSTEQWENEIPQEASLEEHWAVPCCSKDWFLLRSVETKLHLLRPLCDEEGEMTQSFLPLLAQTAAQGCELQ